MFQYAFGKMLAVKHKTKLVLDTSYLYSKLPLKNLTTQLQYELYVFDIKAELQNNFIQSKYLYPLAKAEYAIRGKMNSLQFQALIEQQQNFEPAYLEAKDNTYVRGVFQTEKYFES